MASRYDLILIGSCPGGAPPAQRIAPTGKKILIVEPGGFLPREQTNRSPQALDLNCRAHEIDTLYINDVCFSLSIGAVDPKLTIIANALRVADIIKDRL